MVSTSCFLLFDHNFFSSSLFCFYLLVLLLHSMCIFLDNSSAEILPSAKLEIFLKSVFIKNFLVPPSMLASIPDKKTSRAFRGSQKRATIPGKLFLPVLALYIKFGIVVLINCQPRKPQCRASCNHVLLFIGDTRNIQRVWRQIVYLVPERPGAHCSRKIPSTSSFEKTFTSLKSPDSKINLTLE